MKTFEEIQAIVKHDYEEGYSHYCVPLSCGVSDYASDPNSADSPRYMPEVFGNDDIGWCARGYGEDDFDFIDPVGPFPSYDEAEAAILLAIKNRYAGAEKRCLACNELLSYLELLLCVDRHLRYPCEVDE